MKREKNGWLVEIPPAEAAKTRAFRYEIATGIAGKNGKPAVFRTWDAKYNMPKEMSGATTKYLVKDDAFPKAEDGNLPDPKFVVTPLDSFDNRGRPLTA